MVDDEPSNIGIIQYIFDFNNVRYTALESGMECMAFLAKERPTLLLLDLQMPKMSGWDVLKAIRSTPALADLPVIAVTAHAMVGDRERVLAAGFDGYIPKPISAGTFMEEVKTLYQAVLESRAVPVR